MLLGCSSPTNRPQYDQTPLPPLNVAVETVPPPDGNGNIVRDAVLRVTMDDYPDPDTAVFPLVIVRSGTATFDTQPPHVDLVGHAIELKPTRPLMPQTAYELVIDKSVRALSGRVVGTTLAATLNVGSDLAPSPSPSPALFWSRSGECSDPPQPGDVRCLLPVQNDCVRCHGPMGCTSTRNASSGLDLSLDADDPRLGLVNVPSQLLAGTDRALMRVLPGDAARSELVRKLLGGDPHADSSEMPPNLAVPGRRMPMQEEQCPGLGVPAYWTDDQIRVLQDWIDHGAVVGTGTP
jgi:Bacterial Ig-like domain